jgi:hypothetical protein
VKIGLSKKGDYAARAVLDLALNHHKGAAQSSGDRDLDADSGDILSRSLGWIRHDHGMRSRRFGVQAELHPK